MQKLQEKIERIIVPIGTKISQIKILRILQKSFISVISLTIIGSLVLIIKNFPFINYVISDSIMNEIGSFFGNISTVTTGCLALWLSGAIGYYYSEEEGNPKLFGLLTSLIAFLIATPFTLSVEGLEQPITTGIIPTAYLGGNGLFSAILIGFISACIYNKTQNKGIVIKLPDSVPPAVSEPFKVIIPTLFAFLACTAIRYGFTFTSYGSIHNFFFTVLQTPLMSLGTSLPATLLVIVFVQLLWFLGLHGQNIAMAVMTPIWAAATVANYDAIQAGGSAQYIFTQQFFSAFVWIQFVSLIIACLIGSKSKQLKSLSKLSLPAGCFCISEPIVFGTPVVLNFYLLVPWVLVMLVYVLIGWGAMAIGICPNPIGATIPWTTPPIIAGWLVTGSFMGAIVNIVQIIVGTVIYLPFVKMYDKQLLTQENNTQEKMEG